MNFEATPIPDILSQQSSLDRYRSKQRLIVILLNNGVISNKQIAITAKKLWLHRIATKKLILEAAEAQ